MSIALKQFSDLPDSLNQLSGEVVDCAFKVHSQLGAGFLEINYEDALIRELGKKNIAFERQVICKIPYDDGYLDTEFRFDLVIDKQIIVELKAVEKIHPVHQAQIYAYLKAADLPLGLLINFNVPLIKDGISRYVLRSSESPR